MGATLDTFHPDAGGQRNWPTLLGVTQTLLAPNEWLTVPWSGVDSAGRAGPGDMDFVTITATGLQGSRSAVVRTNSVIEYEVYLQVSWAEKSRHSTAVHGSHKVH